MNNSTDPLVLGEVEGRLESAAPRLSTTLEASEVSAGEYYRTLGLTLAGIIFVADQLVKWFVSGPLALRDRGVIDLLPFFDLRWVENYGVSMGFLTASSDLGRWLLVALTAVISIVVLVWLWREKRRGDVLSLGLVLGGAVGNIVDRARFGYVVDYADLHIGEWRPFLVFNVADAAITIGVLLLLVRAFFTREKKPVRKEV